MVTVSIREREEKDLPDRPRYIVYAPESGGDFAVFGFIQGGETREEAVFWAERFASKNGLSYVAPEGWENVTGALPPEEDATRNG
jgi:hypothetical protein